ncbi:hypothetical protein PG994_002656 [Apiospora phragmitis]|uniref:Uncharacterized protein n=1 Tax=Apiospora phragmitis TaxID=2905665 RepID=A0ABR1W5S7_9PEZI
MLSNTDNDNHGSAGYVLYVTGFLLRREDSFNLACLCKDLYTKLGSRTFVLTLDALQQRREARALEAGHPRSAELGDPLLLLVIRNGIDIRIVEEAYDVFHKTFPESINGRWGSNELIAPHFLAAQYGRLDVLSMLYHAPGVLMYAMYGASEQTASLLIQHFDVYTEFCTRDSGVPKEIFGGLCYLAALLNMPQLLRHLLGWGVNVWAERAGRFGRTTDAWLDILYLAASEGTRDLALPCFVII